ncbi:hypothetical protein ACLOJK_014946 [Asimina triloba]
MSIVLAFRFMPGGGFALSDHGSFYSAILHRFIHVPASLAWWTYRHVDFSPTVIALAAEENWPTLIATAVAPRPSPIRPPYKATISVVLVVAATTAPSHHHQTPSAVVVATPTSTSRPLQKAIIITATSASRSARKTSSKKGQEKDKKVWPSLPEDYTSQMPSCSASAAWSPLWCISFLKPMKKNGSYDNTKGKGHYYHKEGRPTPGVTFDSALTLRESDANEGARRKVVNQLVAECLRKQVSHLSGIPVTTFNRPYPLEIEAKMLPPGLEPPKIQFDGTSGALKHLMSFHYAMGNWAYHSNYCPRMFLNTLIGDAFQ